MKKICKTLVFLILCFLFMNTVNASTCTDGYNSDAFKGWDYNNVLWNFSGQKSHKFLSYDITYVAIKDNILYIHGWAFDHNYSNDVGGTSTTATDDDVNVNLSLFEGTANSDNTLDASKEKFKFKIYYAAPQARNSSQKCGLKGCSLTVPKFYDLTYWNCYRPNYERLCQAGNGDSPYFYGGFAAELDLSQLEDNKTYTLGMKLTGARISTASSNTWTAIGTSETNFDTSISTFNEDNDLNIKISADANSTATVGASVGNIKSRNGTPCTDYSSTDIGYQKYKNFNTKTLPDNATVKFVNAENDRPVACVGGHQSRGYFPTTFGIQAGYQIQKSEYINCYGSNYDDVVETSPSAIKMYPISYYDKDANTTYYGYVPGSWLVFKNQFTIKTGTKDEPDVPVASCPEGSTIYNFYYYFLQGVGVSDFNNAWISNSAASTFSDVDILKGIGINSNSDIVSAINTAGSTVGTIYPITKENIEDFYNNYEQILKSGSLRYYHKAGTNDYYIGTKTWCKKDSSTGDTTQCYDSMTGCELDANGNLTSKNCSKSSYNFSNFLRASIDVDDYYNTKTKETEYGLKIVEKYNKEGLGFDFDISRYYTAADYKMQINLPNAKAIPTATSDNGKKFYLQPAAYRLSFCVNEEAQTCSDQVTGATCNTNGTEAAFHENNDLATCTLDKSQKSGFTIVESSDTNNYCTVACKDDLDFTLPGDAGVVAAGRYFNLDNYIPSIKSTRTCVTSNINYSQFDSDLKSIESNLINLYNIWQGWIKINGNMDTSAYSSGLSTIKETSSSQTCSYTCDKLDENGNVVKDAEGNTVTTTCYDPGTYTLHSWTINASSSQGASVSKMTGTYITNGTTHCLDSTDASKSTYDSSITTPMKNAEAAYEKKLQDYQNTINSYNACYSWTARTKNVAISGRYSIWTGLTSIQDKYKYKFYPDVLFNYEDDNNIFESQKMNREVTTDYTDSYFVWKQGESTNNTYTEGGSEKSGSSSFETTKRNLINCQGDSCSSSDVLATEFFTYSYIKRTEEYGYRYYLDDIVSEVPSGKVSLAKNNKYSNYFALGTNAVPISINTLGGTYRYYLTVDNLIDSKDIRTTVKNDTFEYRFGASGALNSSSSNVCDYQVVNDIYDPPDENDDGKFLFFYRPVDMADINPNNRLLGYNWNDSSGIAEVVKKRMVEASEDYQVLTNDKNRDKFSFTLTPTVMKQIRKYNAIETTNGGYSDFNLSCSTTDGYYYCKSEFLTCLASGGKASGCNKIFDKALNGYDQISDYDDTDLENNRSIFIKKQKSAIGGGT